jgi:hypothetical protein
MKRAICIGVAVAAVTTAAIAQVGQENRGPEQARKTLDTYCTGCHSTAVHAGGVALDSLSLDAVQDHADVWEAAVRKLRGRLMPPPGSRQPDQGEIDSFVGWMEAKLDSSAGGPPKGGHYERRVAGHVPVQRMTRTEYGTAVNDLLGIELDARQLLPAEIEVNGFENVATALSVSPAFLDQYVAAARRAARLAVGESAPKLASAHYARQKGDDQAVHIDGLPLGTRGGMKFRHTFPADGEYRFTIPDLGVDLYTRVVETRHMVVILVDGREVFRESLGGPDDMRTVDRGGAPGRAKVMERFANIPVQVKAGTYDVVVTFIERARIESDEFARRPDATTGGRRPRSGAVQFSRRIGDRQPAADLHLPPLDSARGGPERVEGPSQQAERRTDLCPPHRGEPCASCVPPAGEGGRGRLAHAIFRQRTEGQGRL